MNTTGFAGRRGLLDRLSSTIAGATDGTGGLAVVLGAAGAGKSRLIGEAIGAAEEATGLIALVGQCAGVSTVGEAFLPYKEILLSIAELAAQGDGKARAPRQWIETARSVIPDVLNLLIPGAGIAAKLADGALRHTTRDRNIERTDRNVLFCLVREALFELAQHQPLILVIDDLQWADPPTLELTHYIASGMERTRLAIIIGIRTEDAVATVIPQPCRPLLRELQLHFGDVFIRVGNEMGLKRRQFVDAFVTENYSPNTFTDQFLTRLTEAAGDNALFVQEFLRHLEDQGMLRRGPAGPWDIDSNIAWDTLPPRVEAAVQARLDELDPEAHALAMIAATQGAVFHAQVVAHACGRDVEATTDEIIQRLVRRHRLVEEAGITYSSHGRELFVFQFLHQLFPAALLAGAGVIERARLHRLVLRAMDTCFPPDDPSVMAQRFEHAFSARDVNRTAALAIELAKCLLASHGLEAALAVARRSRSILPRGLQHAWLTVLEAEALESLGRYDQGEQLSTEALTAARELADDELLFHALHVHSVLLRRRAKFATARAVAEELFRVAAAASKTRWCGVACRDVGRAAESEGKYHESLEWYSKALPFVRDDDVHRCGLAEKLAYSSYRSGAFAEAERHYADAITIARAIKDLGVEGSATLNLGILRMAQGRFREATALITGSLTTRRRIGAPVQLAQTLNNLALVSALRGEFVDARAAADESVRILSALEDPLHLSIALDVSGTVSLLRGEHTEASNFYRKARTLSENLGDIIRSRHFTCNEAAVAFLARDLEQLEVCRFRFGEPRAGDPLDYPFAVVISAYTDVLRNQEKAAAARFADAAHLFVTGGDVRFATRAAHNAIALGAHDGELQQLTTHAEDNGLAGGLIVIPRM